MRLSILLLAALWCQLALGQRIIPGGGAGAASAPACVIDLFNPIISENGGGTYTQAGGIDRGANTVLNNDGINLDNGETFTWITAMPRCWKNQALNFQFQTNWGGTPTAGSSNLNIETACVGTSEATTPSFNDVQTITGIDYIGTQNLEEKYTLPLLNTNGCAGGEMLYVRVTFDLNGRTGVTGHRIKGIWVYN